MNTEEIIAAVIIVGVVTATIAAFAYAQGGYHAEGLQLKRERKDAEFAERVRLETAERKLCEALKRLQEHVTKQATEKETPGQCRWMARRRVKLSNGIELLCPVDTECTKCGEGVQS